MEKAYSQWEGIVGVYFGREIRAFHNSEPNQNTNQDLKDKEI